MSNCCNKCGCESPCGCAKPILDIGLVNGSSTELSYNINGLTSSWDFYGIVKAGETDTRVVPDAEHRTFNYYAERHEDIIPANALGKIFHIADFGDVDISGVQNNSLFVYKKDSNCAEGCEGIENSWTAWDALENGTDSAQRVMVFDGEGAPYSLNPPSNGDQYYQLGWNGNSQVSWSQPVEVATPPVDEDGYAYRVYLDPETKRLVVVREAQ